MEDPDEFDELDLDDSENGDHTVPKFLIVCMIILAAFSLLSLFL